MYRYQVTLMSEGTYKDRWAMFTMRAEGSSLQGLMEDATVTGTDQDGSELFVTELTNSSVYWDNEEFVTALCRLVQE